MRLRVFILFLMATLLLSTGLMATEARMYSLGNPQGFVRDYTDIFVFPGTIFEYESTVVGELTNPQYHQDWTIGVIIPFMDNVFSIHLNRPTGLDWDMDDDWRIEDLDLSRKIEFGLGLMDMYGFRFGMAIDSEDNGMEKSALYLELGAGMSTDIMDLGLNFRLAGASSENGMETTGSLFGLALNGRYFLQDDDDFAMMVLAGFDMESFSSEVEFNDESSEDSGMNMMFDLGLGMNYYINDNNLLVLAIKPIKFVSMTEEYDGGDEFTETWLYLPQYFIGLESRIANWLTGRIGANQSYAFKSQEYDPDEGQSSESTEYESEFNMHLGLAFNFGHFTIDTVLHNDFLFNGPDFIGGNANGITSKISVTYNF